MDGDRGAPCCLQVRRSNRLRAGDAGDAIFEEGDELGRLAGWGKTGLAGADDGQRLAGGEMGKSFFEGAGKMELGSFGSCPQNGLAETEDAVDGGFEGLCDGVVRGTSDDYLD